MLITKIAAPPTRLNLVARSRLYQRLDAALVARLTLVVAPPGWGKTTLLTGWLGDRGPQGRIGTIAWVALDERDNDPARFWSYVLGAIDQAYPGVGEHSLAMLRSPTPPPLEVIVGALVQDLATLPRTTLAILVLDDYHAITRDAIHASMTLLLEHQPPQFHLIIAGRNDPPLPLPRLRARDQLVEIRLADLRFTTAEATHFFQETMGMPITSAEVAMIEERTEGWIAAIHLAALWLRNAGDFAALPRSFTGGHRFIVDYLADEVFRRLPSEVQGFLLRTSVLNQLCGALCDAVLDVRAGGAGMLDELERMNLFILPLDDERRWYRYHRLFGEFLRARLEREYPGLANELHQRAAGWYAAHGLTVEAVAHALERSDMTQAVDFIEQWARPLLLRGEVGTVNTWLATLPPALVAERPQLCVLSGWALTLTGNFDQVEAKLHLAEAVMAHNAQAYLPFDMRNFVSEVAAVRATVAGMRRDTQQSIRFARQALELLPEDSLLVRAIVSLMLGNSALLDGEIGLAKQALEQAVATTRGRDMLLIHLFALRQLGELYLHCGHLHLAERTFQQALATAAIYYPREGLRAGKPIPVAGTAYVGLGMVAYERNQLDAAVRFLSDGLELGRQGANIEIILMGAIYLARVQQAQGHPADAEATLNEAIRAARATHVPRLVDWLYAEQAHLWVMQGRLAEALAWSEATDSAGLPYRLADTPTFLREIDYLALVKIAIVKGEAAAALPLLAQMMQLAVTQGRHGNQLALLLNEAWAFYTLGRSSEALASLGHALAIAAPEGYLRTFVDMGQPISTLLDLAIRRGIAPDYARSILATCAAPTVTSAPTPTIRTPETILTDPLSEREIEVLRLVATGLSNQQIADRLVVGLSTVKKHINNIYTKLQVNSRTQAVVRARALGLVTG